MQEDNDEGKLIDFKEYFLRIFEIKGEERGTK